MNTSDAEHFQSPQNSPIEHNNTFYLADDPMAIFLVENQLFKIHRHFLIQESDVIRDMFSIPEEQGREIEGMSDKHPIPLPGATVQEFELLLKHFYTIPQPVPDDYKESLSEEDRKRIQEGNLAILSIAHRFAFDNVFRLMVQRLNPAKIPIIQRIRLGDKYDLNKWLFSAYEELLSREESLNMEELNTLGLDRVICFIRARDFMRKERLTITEAALNNRNQRIAYLEPLASRNYVVGQYSMTMLTPKNAAQVAKEHFTETKSASADSNNISS